jgi:hypothetical protein
MNKLEIINGINTEINDNKLSLSEISLNEDYRKEWNIHCNDFLYLTRNGEILNNNTLYRIGGLNIFKLNVDKYFILIKHKEEYYDKKILESSSSKNPKHLESSWCILDIYGNELIELSTFISPYLVKNSCIYSVSNFYYNIETGECYGHTTSTMETSEYLFLDNKYNKDTDKKGVLRINKSDGKFKLYK